MFPFDFLLKHLIKYVSLDIELFPFFQVSENANYVLDREQTSEEPSFAVCRSLKYRTFCLYTYVISPVLRTLLNFVHVKNF